MVRHIGFDPLASFYVSLPPSIDSNLYLPFDSDLNDDSPNALTGTAVGGASISTSVKKFGAGSLDLSSAGKYVTYPDNSAFDLGSDDFTFEAWIYETEDAYNHIFSKRGLLGNDDDYAYQFHTRTDSPNRRFEFYAYKPDGVGFGKAFNLNPTINTWNHVALVRKGTEINCFLNGVSAPSPLNIGTSSIRSVSSNFSVGRSGNIAQNTYGFRGYIDDFRFTKTAVYTSNFTPPTAALGSTALPSSTFNFRSTFSVDQMREGLSAETWIPRAEGGTITTYGNYVVHTFTSSGTFINTVNRTVDVLIVGGGGSGGQCNASNSAGGGGGGAGGFITSSGTSGANSSPISPLALSAQSYSIVVGSGGAKPAFAEDQVGINGGDSSFAGITAIGGGGGGGNSTEGSVGGSGGGGAESNGVGRSGTANQGMAGGDGSEADDKGGGGGGAGQAGSDYNVSNGKGGDGLANSIQTGSPIYYAGGGGAGGSSTLGNGGAGGLGGGGAAGVAGTANTGGGGGSDLSGEAGAGGSGIVVIRYQI